MKIDRSNYEIWIIDWLDGNLSDPQVEQLKIFLGKNPDLREEFEEFIKFSLKPADKSFPGKKHLKKSTEDLSGSQFEYLCVASLENDLSADQQTELRESIDQLPEKKRLFELIRKMRLTPANITYKHKNHLIKRTVAQKVIRLSTIGLSAAAAVALIVTTYLIIPRNISENNINTAQNIVADSTFHEPAADMVTDTNTVPDIVITDTNPDLSKQIRENLIAEFQMSHPVVNHVDSTISIPDDSLRRIIDNPETELQKIPVNIDIDIIGSIVSNTLVASDNAFINPAYDNERNNLSKLIAKIFRQKILKENASQDSPLKGYEIAEAGVSGLNALLGWEMSLDKNNDENGELRSVYFSSKILKFNAPVKKTEPLP